ncbi:hypothetical protein ACFORH_42670 [Amycolatopsis roodepoortensis]|uniref:Uncharacterized protein n=1 Tax=Amycolatopsis roodepoortensis TaxID=700274 RepID=A0ABR9LM42_9PSEU|nr:hypothetical protein [Amycolatopsis roodepoortensis]MBE1574799.1 hypothetical protein [Amycolatopsis roodepoortensis]MBE1574813.1 hypothetical protein [Amycolatopsis roodepoortensis]MBE1581735.1 hypothetical protein [Amycolatopsis roodepoortensis]
MNQHTHNHESTTSTGGLSAARLAAIADALTVPDGGFTVDPATGDAARTGYAVAVHPEYEHICDGHVTAEDLADYLIRTRHVLALPGRVFGGWCDPGTRRVYLDVSAVVATLHAALELGRDAGQRAVFDLDAATSIPVPPAPLPVVGKEPPVDPTPPIPAPRAERTPPPCPPGNHARTATSRPPSKPPAGGKPTPKNRPGSTPKRLTGGPRKSPTSRRSPKNGSPHSR